MKAKDRKWHTEITAHLDLIVREFKQMHGLSKEDNISSNNAIYHLKCCIDFRADLKRPENVITPLQFSMWATRMVGGLIVAVQLVVNDFFAHTRELYREAPFNTSTSGLQSSTDISTVTIARGCSWRAQIA